MKLMPMCLLFVASFGLTACITPVDDPEPKELAGSRSSAAKVDPDGNGLDTWKVVNAVLLNNPFYAHALLNSPIRNESMNSGIKASVCNDSNSREVLRYVVRCAFNDGHDLTLTCSNGDHFPMKGLFGLANSWGDVGGSCTTDSCQEWVSGCVLALSNFAGATGISVELNGYHTALRGDKSPSYPRAEGAYWGDIFNETGSGQKRYGCRGADAAQFYRYGNPASFLKLQSRTCGNFNASDGCEVCTGGTSSDVGNNCTDATKPYFMNLYNGDVRTCSPLCATDAGTTSGYFNNCTPTGSGTASLRVLTVWRQ